MKTLQAVLLEESQELERNVPAEELNELLGLLGTEDSRRVCYLVVLARRALAESILYKMLKALDNDEKINNAAPIETLNCIQKILKMEKDSTSELAKMAFKRLSSSFNVKEISN